jgi:iron complex outermembrane receptor protein
VARAQQESSDGASGSDIVVTARRTSETLQKVPVAVTALSTTDLEHKRVLSAQDLSTVAPGLTVAQGGASSGRDTPIFTIRGQGQSFGVAQPGIVTYFAEVPGAVTSSFFDLENIQVLYGPQGTLFGSNTTGGAVLLTPKVAGFVPEGFLTVRTGSYWLREVEAAVNVPLIDDVLSVRAAVQYRGRDGFTKDVVTGVDYDNLNRLNGRVSVTLQPTASIKNVSIFYFERIEENGGGTSLNSLDPARANAAAVALMPLLQQFLAEQEARGPRRINLGDNLGAGFGGSKRASGIINTLTWDASDSINLKYIFGHYKTRAGFYSDVDSTPLPVLQIYPEGLPLGRQKRTTHEFVIKGNFLDDRLKLTLGGFASNSGTDGPGGAGIATFLPVPFALWPAVAGAFGFNVAKGLPYTDYGLNGTALFIDVFSAQTDTSRAIYGGGEFEVVDGLKLSAGLRYTKDKGTSQSFNTATLTSPIAIPSGPEQHGSWDATTWHATATYQISPRAMIYATARTGYRGGGFNASAPSSRGDLAAYDPEHVTDFEIGVKATYEVGRAAGYFDAAAYYDKYKDIQRTIRIPLPGNVAVAVTQNAARASVKGFQFDTGVSFNRVLNVDLSYAYTDAGYSEWNDFDPVTNAPIDRSGNEFQHTPKHKITASVTINLPVSERTGTMSLGGNLGWQSQMWLTNDINFPDTRQDPYALVNMRADWREIFRSRLSAALFVTNVTNKTYRIMQMTASDGSNGFGSALYGEPRMFGVELNYRY